MSIVQFSQMFLKAAQGTNIDEIFRKAINLGQISPNDARDAVNHLSDFDDPDKYLYSASFIPRCSIKQIHNYDDCGWLDIEPGSLVGLDKPEFLNELQGFRGLNWALRAWEMRDSIPAIIVIQTPNSTGICDGRGRFNLAVGLDTTFPALIIEGEYL